MPVPARVFRPTDEGPAMFRARLPFVLLLVLLALAAPARAERYMVSVLPLRGIVAQLVPDAEVTALVGPGQSPHLYEPSARQLTLLASARAVFTVGVPFERMLVPRARKQFPDLRWVDATAGIALLALPPMAAGDADAGHDGHVHAEGESDPHVWMGPTPYQQIVRTIAAALSELRPNDAAAIGTRRDAMIERIAEVERELAARLASLRGDAVLAYHPAYGYFTEHFGLRQLAVESGGAEPGARHLIELAGRIREEKVTLLLVQPQSSPDRARTLARTLGIDAIEVDPLREDVVATWRELADALVAAHARAAGRSR